MDGIERTAGWWPAAVMGGVRRLAISHRCIDSYERWTRTRSLLHGVTSRLRTLTADELSSSLTELTSFSRGSSQRCTIPWLVSRKQNRTQHDIAQYGVGIFPLEDEDEDKKRPQKLVIQ